MGEDDGWACIGSIECIDKLLVLNTLFKQRLDWNDSCLLTASLRSRRRTRLLHLCLQRPKHRSA